MRRRLPPFVAGNWKMHLTRAEAGLLLGAVAKGAPALAPAELIVLPPFTALAEAASRLAGGPVAWGGQNLHWEDKGAYTGEISGPMLADAGCRFVTVGHSERRQYFGETDETVNRRTLAALRAGLRPIVCFGETLEQRESGKTMEIITGQLDNGLAGLAAEPFGRVVLAYEPVWAIGTGRTATPAQAEEVHAFVRARLRENMEKRPPAVL